MVTVVTCAFVNLQHHQVKLEELLRSKWASRGILNLSPFDSIMLTLLEFMANLGRASGSPWPSWLRIASSRKSVHFASPLILPSGSFKHKLLKVCRFICSRTTTKFCRRNQPGNSNTLLPSNSPPSNPSRTDIRLRWTQETYIQAKQAIRSRGWCCKCTS